MNPAKSMEYLRVFSVKIDGNHRNTCIHNQFHNGLVPILVFTMTDTSVVGSDLPCWEYAKTSALLKNGMRPFDPGNAAAQALAISERIH